MVANRKSFANQDDYISDDRDRYNNSYERIKYRDETWDCAPQNVATQSHAYHP